jgi:integrase
VSKTAFKFTAAAVERLKPPAAGRVDYSNTAIPGMQLRVSASGKKVYRVKTRISGVQQAETIGNAAVLSLAEANKRAREFLAQASAGINPVAERRRQEAEAAAAPTIERVMVERYFPYAKQRMRPVYYKETVRALRRDVLPVLGQVRIDQLTRRQIRDVLGGIVGSGRQSYAAHVFAYFRTFLGWAVREDIITANPAAGIPDPDTRRAEDRSRSRWLDDDEIRLFWFAANRVGSAFGPLFQLLLLTGARRDELAEAPWSEFDLERRTWLLPAARSKNGNDHICHLSEPTLRLLEALPRFRPGDPGEHLFSTTGTSPLVNFDAAIKRVRAEMAAQAGRPIPHFTLHDLRRTFASHAAELGVDESIVDRCLNHTSRGRLGTVAAIYNRSDRLPARAEALNRWADHVMKLVRPQPVEIETAG